MRHPCFALLCLLALSAPPVMAAGEPLTRGNQTLELFISEEFSPAAKAELRAWIDFTAGALAGVYGHWPRKHWQVAVTPVSGFGEDPIPWAQVHRGDVDRIEFYITPRADAQDLRRAWTGYHEMAHLLIPYRGWGDAWFSEGLATYYQNLLQVRAGVIDEQQMWQNMHDGFQRGMDDTRFDGQPLHTVSNNMRVKGGFMRVYWSGAWYFLQLDARLRRQSRGAGGLDAALARLNTCCADTPMSARDMASRLDSLNEVYIFLPLYEQVRDSTAVPAYDSLFASLGISVVDGEVRLQQSGPGADLRRQIAKPQPR